jgi:hypothetical protein
VVTLDAPAALLAELTARNIELQAHGDRLRFRPQRAMTPDLLARVAAQKPGLLALLAEDAVTKTRCGATVERGVGDGDAGDMLATTSCAASEAKMLSDVPAELRRVAIAMMPVWNEIFEERAAIMEYDGGVSREEAEMVALADTLGQLTDSAD